jgi:cysteine desulfurase/selenocysteine lyase
MTSLVDANRVFPATERWCYLNTAAEGLAPVGLGEALNRYAIEKGGGSEGRRHLQTVEHSCRVSVGRLLGCTAGEIAFCSSYSEALAIVLSAFRWAPGDAIVTSDLEFPATRIAARHLGRYGVEVKVVRTPMGEIEPDVLRCSLDSRVRLAVLSLVAFKTGAVLDLPAISRILRESGVPLFVDATQAAGVVPFNIADADFAAASCFKWLLGSHGLAILYVNRRWRGDPGFVGWRLVDDLFAMERGERERVRPDARRFELGMPAYPSLYALRCGLDVIEPVGMAAIAGHVRALTERLIRGFESLGLAVLTPRAHNARGGIATSAVDGCEDLVARLRGQGIVAWGRLDCLRVSVHLYNGAADVDRLFDALEPLQNKMLKGSRVARWPPFTKQSPATNA